MEKQNNSKKYIILIIGILLIVFGLFKFWGGTQRNTNSKQTEKVRYANVPNLEIRVIDYTKTINYYCDPVSITMEIKNNGPKTLKYQDLLEKKYQFGLEGARGNVFWAIFMKNKPERDKDGVISLSRATIKNFGEIKPGEKKQVVIESGADHVFYLPENDSEPYILTNIFASEIEDSRQHTGEVNKEFKFKVAVDWLKDDKHHPQIAESNEFIVYSNIYDDSGELKVCPYIKN